ncbi:Hypothetical predicted protein [Octopus vulgaris]|uniref:Uncharacterized protein n=1 Tax=Octopus vulgaris TaxID=6645 RepID=A0AA36BNX6_OCTVU|nr:Hypothetical predicted protein [Octopus vulgaris]
MTLLHISGEIISRDVLLLLSSSYQLCFSSHTAGVSEKSKGPMFVISRYTPEKNSFKVTEKRSFGNICGWNVVPSSLLMVISL